MISVILHTVQNLGDHGREVKRVITVDENITIKELIDKVLIDKNHDDHIELKIPLELGN